MLINASPDAGPIDISFNGKVINNTPLSYTQNTGYSLIDAGVYQVVTTKQSSNVQLLSVPMLLKSRRAYSVFFAGQAKGNQMLYVATEDSLKNPNKNRAKYRFINVSQNSRTLDFRLVAAKDSVLIANIPFGTASNFNQIKPAKYTFKVISRDTSVKTIDTISYTLENGKIYTFWAKGLINTTGANKLGIKVIKNK